MSKQWWVLLASVAFFSTIFAVIFASSWYWQITFDATRQFLSPQSNATPVPLKKPLEAFTFANLAKREYKGSIIQFGKQFPLDREDIVALQFFYESDGKKVSGRATLPFYYSKTPDKLPVVIMIRGYVDKEKYAPGVGTQRVAEYLAARGYITLAPDFLGYGDSDQPETAEGLDPWWERFNNPVVVLNLIASLASMPQADTSKVGIWAHSNGGQIALSVLEISGKEYPTTLWAPVSQSFPYSVLYFTPEFPDEGKYLRKKIAELELLYDVRDFSITDYFSSIKAPLQLHQGTGDEAVPYQWSRTLHNKLLDEKVAIEYFEYPEADHNLLGGWELAVERDLRFFNNHLK